MAEVEKSNVLSPLEEEGLRGDGQARWYVVHTYSGYENKVKLNIEKMVENRGMQDLIKQIVVPMEDRLEIRGGQRKIVSRKLFPGYVIIKMIVTNESWYLVRNTEGVTGFVGHGFVPVQLVFRECGFGFSFNQYEEYLLQTVHFLIIFNFFSTPFGFLVSR